jgi:replicative DNA helicase
MNTLAIEKQVIGSLIATPDLYVSVSDLLTEGCFSDSKCKKVFEALMFMFGQDQRVSFLTLDDRLLKLGTSVSVSDFIGSINAGDSFQEHCLLLKEREMKRMQIDLGLRLTAMGADDKEDVFDTNDLLMAEAERIANSVGIGKEKTNAQYLASVTDAMDRASTTNGITGIRTGFTELDQLYSGRQKSDLIIRAARPSMGKTALTLCEALHMAVNEDKKVLFFSLEMSGEQLFQRLVAVHTGIYLHKIQRGQLTDLDYQKYNRTTPDLTTNNLRIVDDVFTLNGIRTKARKTKMQHGLDVVFIDYLQLINHKTEKGRSKENEVSEVSRSLKMLAKALDVPVVCLSQLSRAVETRGGAKIPKLSDLRDSGAIEQDADIVEFIYRPEMDKTEVGNGEPLQDDGVAYIVVAKHRNGACGDIELFFNKPLTRFENKKVEGYAVEKHPTSMRPNASFYEPKDLEDIDDGDVF